MKLFAALVILVSLAILGCSGSSPTAATGGNSEPTTTSDGVSPIQATAAALQATLAATLTPAPATSRASPSSPTLMPSSTLAPTAITGPTSVPVLSQCAPGEGDGKQYPQPPAMAINAGNSYVATMDTNKGKIVIELLPEESPITVNNFIFLARECFYDDVIFHRVIPGFMIQGGDPLGQGTGGPGYRFADETSSSLAFSTPGLLAMANSGPNTNGSQFFITTVPTPHLSGNHTIFGRVTEGQDIVEAIALVPRSARDKPVEDVVILSIEVAETAPSG
jgi:cyclophilin family peptidyl-prolyl cis-trans isomerase